MHKTLKLTITFSADIPYDDCSGKYNSTEEQAVAAVQYDLEKYGIMGLISRWSLEDSWKAVVET